MYRLELHVGGPARISVGSPSSRACRKRSSRAMQSGTAVCGGGTNTALPGREPPIQSASGGTRPAACRHRARATAARHGSRGSGGSTGESRPAGDRGRARGRRRSSRPRPRRRTARRAPRRARTAGGPTATTACPRSRGEHRLLPHVGVEKERLVRRSVETPSRRPSARPAASRDCCSGPSSADGRWGGSGLGTKARTCSPPAAVTS